MRWFSLLVTAALMTACTTYPVESDTRTLAQIKTAVTINWGIRSENPGHLQFAHAGIPGNLAVLEGTRDANGNQLKAVVLGPPLEVNRMVPIKILGVLEQVGPNGLISTIIATVGPEDSLMDLETQRSGSLAVLEAGLVKLESGTSRSLGFQSAPYALNLIQQSR